MAVELTLNDFRNVLGKVNDGNVVLTQDQSGIAGQAQEADAAPATQSEEPASYSEMFSAGGFMQV